MNRGDVRLVGLAALLVAAAAAAHFLHVTPVLALAAAAAAIALLARLIGGATEQLGGRVGSSAAGVVQPGRKAQS
jgi:Ca2+:H+ antiporter